MVAGVLDYFERHRFRPVLADGLFQGARQRSEQQLTKEKERLRLWVPVLFGIGIGIYFSLLFEPPIWAGAVLVAPLFFASSRLRRREGLAGVLVLAMCIIAAGFAAAQVETWWVRAPMLDAPTKPVRVAGRLEEIEQMPSGSRLVIRPKYIAGLNRRTLPHFVRIHVKQDAATLETGEWVSLRAMLLPPPPPSIPGGYDFQRQAYFERLGAVGFGIGHVFAKPANSMPWTGQLLALRYAIAGRIRAVLPGTEGAIAAAIITGQRGGIPGNVNEDFRNSGLSHLLVIAGLHMSLLIAFAFFTIRGVLALIPPIALRYPIKKWAAAAALVLALSYLAISGAAIPTQRAFIMCALVLGATLTDRLHLSMHGVAIAALAALVFDPEAVTRVSFQMSFAAVVGLIGFYETWGSWLAARHRNAGWLGKVLQHFSGVAVTTIVATVATAPFSLYHFNQLALFSILANVIAVPVAAFCIMPCALVSCVLMPIGCEAAGLMPMGWAIALVERVAHWTGSLPGAVLHMPTMPSWGLVLIALGSLWLCLWQSSWRRWGVVFISIGFASYCFVAPPDLLVAPDAKLFAVRAVDGTYQLSSSRSDKMVAESWQRASAGALWKSFSEAAPAGDSNSPALVCNDFDCSGEINGHRFALRPWNVASDNCPAADLIVSRRDLDPVCKAGAIAIDPSEVAKNGAYAIWARNKLRVERDYQRRGTRPWVVRPTTALKTQD